MAVRPPHSPDRRLLDEIFDKLIGRIYLLWLVGVLVSSLELRAERFSVGGIAYAIENADVVPGMLFIACLLYYAAFFGRLVMVFASYPLPYRGYIRRYVYMVVRNVYGGSFKRMNARDIRVGKSVARTFLRFANGVMLMILLLPAIHILVFEFGPLVVAVRAMVGMST